MATVHEIYIVQPIIYLHDIFALVMHVLIRHIRDGSPWCMLLKTLWCRRKELNHKLKFWRVTLISKGFRLSRTKRWGIHDTSPDSRNNGILASI